MDPLTEQRTESRNLARAYAENPAEFNFQTTVEDAQTLERIGVFIPGKERHPAAYLRLWPEDFVVEEVAPDGSVVTVEAGDFNPGDGPQHATVVKCGASNHEMVRELARQLGIRDTQIGYAGMKDKAAITAQRISIQGATADAIRRVESPLFFLKDFAPGKQIGIGHLKGNRFTITLRFRDGEPTPEQERAVAESLARVRDHGFYNYYFTQRFGPPRLGKERWGAAMVRGDIDAVVRAALTEPAGRGFSFFDRLRGEALARYGHWAEMRAIFEPYPKTFRNELLMLEALERTNDPWEAILAGKEQAKMWIFILESWLFNRALAREVSSGRTPPADLPVTLFSILGDREYPNFEDDLASLGVSRAHRANLRSIPFCRLVEQRIETVKRPQIHSAKMADGLLLTSFTLDKGSYATAFLSHAVCLASGRPFPAMRRERIDARGVLGLGSIVPATERFDAVTHEKTDELRFDEPAADA